MLDRILARLDRLGRTTLTHQVGPYLLEVLGVRSEPHFIHRHRGESFLLGRRGERYLLRVQNASARQVEVVVTVDGRDVIDGEAADFAGKRGYLVPAWGSVTIEGWRVSSQRVAAFRFAEAADAYAAQQGATRDIGVIAAAIFPEGRIDWEDRCVRSVGCAPGAPAEAAAATVRRRSGGLGTAFGEALSSAVREVPFCRDNPARPAAILGLRYSDRRGLSDLGVRAVADTAEGGARYCRPPEDWEWE